MSPSCEKHLLNLQEFLASLASHVRSCLFLGGLAIFCGGWVSVRFIAFNPHHWYHCGQQELRLTFPRECNLFDKISARHNGHQRAAPVMWIESDLMGLGRPLSPDIRWIYDDLRCMWTKRALFQHISTTLFTDVYSFTMFYSGYHVVSPSKETWLPWISGSPAPWGFCSGRTRGGSWQPFEEVLGWFCWPCASGLQKRTNLGMFKRWGHKQGYRKRLFGIPSGKLT